MLSSLSSTIITVFDIADLAYLGPDASAKTLRGQRIGGSAQQPPRTGNARDCKRHRTEPGMNSLIVPPVTRVVLPCTVNERLRSAGQFKGGVSGTPVVVPANAKGGLRAPAARVSRPGPLGMYVGWIVRRETSTTGKWRVSVPLRCPSWRASPSARRRVAAAGSRLAGGAACRRRSPDDR